MPLRVRLTLLFVLGTSLVLAAAGTLFYVLLRTNLRNSLDTNLRTRADVLAARIPGETDPATELRADGVGLAQLLRPDGSVVASTAALGSRPLLDRDQLDAAVSGPALFTLGHRDGQDEDLRALAVPLGAEPAAAEPATPAPAAGRVLVVATSTKLVDDAEDRVRDIMFVATAPMVALSGLAAWLLSGAALRPVDRMRRQAAALSASDSINQPRSVAALQVPSTRDEIAALAVTMNDLLGRLHDARARDRAFVADAGHELRTPLTNLKAELELAGRPGRSVEELVEAVANASDETDRLVRLAESLLALARLDSGVVTYRRVAVADLLERAARAAAGYAASHDVAIQLDLDPTVVVDADPDMLRRAVDNLLVNAVSHAPAGTTVELRARCTNALGAGMPGGNTPGGTTLGGDMLCGDTRDADVGTVAVIEVRDHGAGFPAEFLPHAFERFSRADAARTRDHGGTGLGLAIAAATTHAHGGTVSAANHPDGGAVVTLVIPTAGGRTLAP